MMSLPRITVCGTQGRWAVFVPGYGDIAIVPDLWKERDFYRDPLLVPGVSKTEELVRRLQETGLVVTADFELDGDPFDLQTKWKRREYIALWRITDFSFDADGLSFRFVEALADVGKKNKWQEPRRRTRRGVGSY